MSAAILAAAIIAIHPFIPADRAGIYASLILTNAEQFKVDPLIVAARISVETRYHWDQISRTKDYGLMQLHVSKTTRPAWLGFEKALLEPSLNIHLGVKALKMWKRYHKTKCKGEHPWWLHYKYGTRVPAKGTARSQKVMHKYLRLFRKWTARRGRSRTES
jgi:hypothetical protein